jgi:hypothetical protein
MHVRAETVENDSLGVWERISSGPYHWNTVDKVLFWSLIMCALEILNYLCAHSGGERSI